ncbi:Tellurite resistance protein TehA [Shimia sp. SK013]|uniref:SLAC1 anion channel family protein n=1 Tax=Shimia sp. SK013 TaxID=1389006 RepID=UPI0006B62A34|nr:SLAC1 anion channel family protein [Shimia sp. SK013]KPA22702.1 Tellurite resistance protein TehA [Shimia sp. SK013]
MTEASAQTSKLQHFPVPIFATIMGLMGWALAFHAVPDGMPLAGRLSSGVMWIGTAVFAGLATLYLVKLVRFPEAVRSEWNHPVRLAFFPAISISLLLLSTAMWAHFPDLAKGLWLTGATGQVVLTLAVVSGWISHRSFEVGQLTPAWFIPAVGNVVAPIAGAQMGFVELSWLFFSAGVIFWVVLLTLVFNRLIFHDPIPGKLLPTLVILIAPPAVAFSAYVSLTGQVDGVARIFLNAAYIFAALVLVQAPKFRHLPFALSWWALSFPVAALAIASFRFGGLTDSDVHTYIGYGVLVVLSVTMIGLIARTLLAAVRGEICVPE